MTDPAPTLKPCPFCGYTKPIRPSSSTTWAVVCPKCDAVGPYSPDWPDRAIDLAIAAWNARADDWRPIETAPKDGTRFLAYSQDLTGNDLPPFQSVIAWHDDAGFCTCELREPTHWRPLPAPPETTDDV